MSVMNNKSFTLKAKGLVNALITYCIISRAFNPSGKGPVPESKTFSAIWDTGATNSVISMKVVAELGLKPMSKSKMSTASSIDVEEVDAYFINIMLPNKVGIAYLRVLGCSLNDADVLIGMDIIGKGDFAITHSEGNTTFSFQIPSTHDIDFTKNDS